MDRRIAELSAEIHATSDLMDFSETNLSGQLKGLRDQIANVIAMPTVATRNSGLELEDLPVGLVGYGAIGRQVADGERTDREDGVLVTARVPRAEMHRFDDLVTV